jgi:hypothetical protein
VTPTLVPLIYICTPLMNNRGFTLATTSLGTRRRLPAAENQSHVSNPGAIDKTTHLVLDRYVYIAQRSVHSTTTGYAGNHGLL